MLIYLSRFTSKSHNHRRIYLSKLVSLENHFLHFLWQGHLMTLTTFSHELFNLLHSSRHNCQTFHAILRDSNIIFYSHLCKVITRYDINTTVGTYHKHLRQCQCISKGTQVQTMNRDVQKIYKEYLHLMLIMCAKFNSNTLKMENVVW